MSLDNPKTQTVFDQEQPAVAVGDITHLQETTAVNQVGVPTSVDVFQGNELVDAGTQTPHTIGNQVVPEQTGTPPNPNRWSRAQKRTMALLGGTIIAASAALGLTYNSGGDESSSVSLKQPPASAEPAPTTTEVTVPPTTVALKPAVTTPTTPRTTEKSIPPTSAPKPAEAETSNTLSDSELKKIINATGFKGLEGHDLQVVSRFDEVVIVSVDGSELPVPLPEIKSDLAIAKSIAAQHLSFNLGNQGEESEYQASPSNAKERVIFVTDKDPRLLSEPVNSFPNAYTTSNPGSINVTVLKNQPGETRYGVSSNGLDAAVETFQTETSFTPYAQENRARERYANSWGYALESARAGVSYADYAAQAAAITLLTSTDGDRYFVVGQEAYGNLAA